MFGVLQPVNPMTKVTAHSEYGKLCSVLIKRPKEGFISDEVVAQQWESLNYLGQPEFHQSCLDYQQLEDLFHTNGTTIHHLPESDQVTMDSIYCRDASIATNHGMIICRMGKPARQNEPSEERNYFRQNGIQILGEIESPGTIEGGDVAWLDEKTLAVGRGYRTNDEGIGQLKKLVEPHDIEVIVVELPHYKGEEDVFHLMSILSPVDEKKAVVYSRLMPVRFREYLLNRGFKLIEVPDEEFESMGCNVLAIEPSHCLMVSGNPITKNRLEKAGCKVVEYDGAEISAKGCGGPTCLTRPIWRE